MAIAYVAERGHANTSNTGATEVIAITANCTAGNRLVLFFAGRDTATTGISVSDSKGNTWTVDGGPYNANNDLVMVASTLQNAAALTTSDTVTITFGTFPTNRLTWIEEFSGMGAVDVIANNLNTGSVTALDGGTTTVLSASGEAVVSLFCVNSGTSLTINATGTVGSYSRFAPPGTGDQTTTSGTNDKTSGAYYQVNTSSANQKCALTASPGTSYQAVTVVYKASLIVKPGDDSLQGAAADNAVTKPVGSDSSSAPAADTATVRVLAVDDGFDIAYAVGIPFRLPWEISLAGGFPHRTAADSTSLLSAVVVASSDSGTAPDNAVSFYRAAGADGSTGSDSGVLTTPISASDSASTAVDTAVAITGVVKSATDAGISVDAALPLLNATDSATAAVDAAAPPNALVYAADSAVGTEAAAQHDRPQGERTAIVTPESRVISVLEGDRDDTN